MDEIAPTQAALSNLPVRSASDIAYRPRPLHRGRLRASMVLSGNKAVSLTPNIPTSITSYTSKRYNRPCPCAGSLCYASRVGARPSVTTERYRSEALGFRRSPHARC